MLVFSWGGSGGDKLTSEVRKVKDGHEVLFKHAPGLTLDYRMHMRLYAIQSGVTIIDSQEAKALVGKGRSAP